MISFTRYIPDECAMLQFGQQLANAIRQLVAPQVVCLYLNGDLGAGKTLLSRGVIQTFGHSGKVKSPTYTLVEEYKLAEKTIYHFDLYRLGSPEELEFMGIRDYFSPHSLCLIEWPEKGQGLLPEPDLFINISYINDARQIELLAQTDSGNQLIHFLLTQ
ncbi:tRNA (adenosine(37)-N6)-threonylcarbamoyltransferase complex ATPase subunit type 1 TsaE [Rodentibacter caecimuris]|uniref:tRNA threonylcarbamoyladenosine biosynthesis protein TsaE n=1 Tax=Rodentibacter caecimuris TaxID=1796644 RepID=A0ABX3KYL1_9PAST|nr:tRNA (adenosine(37)-N6)-threonylcarbamoyltransferase complex ATPase subunit type 1 TsaE [Rodentibacter heylii]